MSFVNLWFWACTSYIRFIPGLSVFSFLFGFVWVGRVYVYAFYEFLILFLSFILVTGVIALYFTSILYNIFIKKGFLRDSDMIQLSFVLLLCVLLCYLSLDMMFMQGHKLSVTELSWKVYVRVI